MFAFGGSGDGAKRDEELPSPERSHGLPGPPRKGNSTLKNAHRTKAVDVERLRQGRWRTKLGAASGNPSSLADGSGGKSSILVSMPNSVTAILIHITANKAATLKARTSVRLRRPRTVHE